MPKYLTTEAKKLLLRLLHKEPKKRPTLIDLKRDAFFTGDIDWIKLEKKEIKPPQVLAKMVEVDLELEETKGETPEQSQ